MTQDITAAEILYKLGGLESQVKEGMNNLDKQITSLRSEIQEIRHESKSEIKELDTRITTLETFKHQLIAKVSGVFIILVGLWAVFGDKVQDTVQRII